MKKTLLFIAAILMSISVFAQTRTTFINEHFDATTMPEGWQIMDMGNSNWSVSATQNAGGQANEMKLDWSPQFNGMTRLATPAVDLTGVTSVVFSFKHALDNYQGSNSIGVATSSDGGTTWNDAWTQTYSSSGAWSVSQNITTADMGNNNVMFCIYFNGNSYNINDWYFDDIEVFTMENLDLSLNSIDIPSAIGAGTIDIPVTVQNKGVSEINQIVMEYKMGDDDPVEEVFDLTLASLATTQLTFSVPVTVNPGDYILDVNILTVNGNIDDDSSNNNLSKILSVALGETQKIPMIEHFSSSTCGPCVNVNTTMLNFTNTHPGMFTYTKYQMNWPGNGDPYYTAEGGVRRNYYGVNAVPQCFLDGADQGYAAVSTSVFDSHYADPAFGDVRGSFFVDGNVINVRVDYMGFYTMTEEKAFVTVNEKETHGNVGSNGETSFHHVFMKFLTDPSGDALNIVAGGYQHEEYSFDMSSTHVEEMSDLEVSAWIQNVATHEIINSHFLYEYTEIHPYPVATFIPVWTENGVEMTWTDFEGAEPLGYDFYVNGELVAADLTEHSYMYECEDGLYVFGIQCKYPDEMTSVKVLQAYLYEGDDAVIDNEEAKYNIYPNPTNGNINVKGENINLVEVYNICGQKVMSVEANSSNVNVNMSELTTGVYMVKIVDSNSNATVKKVVKK